MALASRDRGTGRLSAADRAGSTPATLRRTFGGGTGDRGHRAEAIRRHRHSEWTRSSRRSATRSATSSSSPLVQFGLRAIFVYLVILWLATAYWAFRDMQQRSDNAILPYLVAAGIILFTPVFFIFAVWVYKIVRPHEKIGEVWERNLAEEALLAEVEAIHHCPTCDRRVNDEWIICPSCRTRLNRVCPNCSRLVGLDWSLCAWCGKDFERREAPRGDHRAAAVRPRVDAPG